MSTMVFIHTFTLEAFKYKLISKWGEQIVVHALQWNSIELKRKTNY